MDRRIAIVLVLAAAAIGAAALIGAGSRSNGVSETTDLSTKPVIPAQTGTPPTGIKKDDIVTGNGTEVKSGDTVTVRYSGVLYDGGTEFDSSWTRTPNTTTFPLTGVIPCWTQGLVGMKVGGRRQLTCPSDLAYGAQGQPPTIPADAALVFVVDLVKTAPSTATQAPASPAGK